MGIPIAQVDAFTDEPFRGNPAAVCLLDWERDAAWMQSVAAEMNLSETAFLLPEEGAWRLRWFTPTVEVALCGHATLASAHVLFARGGTELTFRTNSGELRAWRRDERIEMDFPASPVRAEPPPDGLVEALGVEPRFTGVSRFDRLVEVGSEAELLAVAPDFDALERVDTRGTIVTCCGDDGAGVDFVSRFFCPAVGIREDPVTGSAHCALAPFWAERLGRNAMTGYQASARGGLVSVRLEGERVFLGGRAVTVFEGELRVG